MKKIKCRLWYKLLLALLLTAAVLGFTVSAIGAVIMQHYGGFEKDRDSVLSDFLEQMAESHLNNIEQQLRFGIEPKYVSDTEELCFKLWDRDGKLVYDGLEGRDSLCTVERELGLGYYRVSESAAGYVQDESLADSAKDYGRIAVFILKDNNGRGEIMSNYRVIDFCYSWKNVIPMLIGLTLVAGIVFFLLLMSAAGHHGDSEEIGGGFMEKIPYDVMLLLCFLFVCAMIALVDESMHNANWLNPITMEVIGFAAVAAVLVGVGFCVTTAARLKQKRLIKSCLCYMFLAWLWKYLKKPLVFFREALKSAGMFPKAVACMVGLVILEFLWMAAAGRGPMILGMLLERAVLCCLGIYALLNMKFLMEGAKDIAAGKLERKLDTEKLYGPFKEHGEDLNSITAGMNKAVNERMKSERFKTQLITNVSHDIKTPLTSIINYVDLMEKEQPESEKMREYLSVLTRQSAKLKKLIDDLLEASKASTGNLNVNTERLELGVLLTQAAGEYSERMAAAGLELIVTKPEESLWIMADGRHMWRIFDNLLSNIQKYAQQGSRVYVDLHREGDRAEIIFRNMSAARLNVSGEELLERFVQGDSSRSSEGSGLGLNIAQSLTQLQKGKIELTVDGDLFKVKLDFAAAE